MLAIISGRIEPVAAGHLEDDEDRGHGRADDPGEDGAHSHERERADLPSSWSKSRDVEAAERAAEHAPDEEGGREDAAGAAARVENTVATSFIAQSRSITLKPSWPASALRGSS